MNRSCMIRSLFLIIMCGLTASVGSAAMEFVSIGDAGNSADTRALGAYGINAGAKGAVGYVYGIGKYEVTNAQYCEFLNAVAKNDQYGLYDPNMGNPAGPVRGGIARSGSQGNYAYTAIAGREDMPVNWVSWRSAARMANWMHNGMKADPATAEYGAYDASTFTGTGWSKSDQTTHNPGARYWIPTADEWYKAAFYKGNGTTSGYWNYATASDAAPNAGPYNTTSNRANYQSDNYNFGGGFDNGDLLAVGYYSLSPGAYGTFDMSGSVNEWVEDWSLPNYTPLVRATYGGGFKTNSAGEISYDSRSHAYPDRGNNALGFRLAGPGCSAAVPGDADGNCRVDFVDFSIVMAHWTECNLVLAEGCD